MIPSPGWASSHPLRQVGTMFKPWFDIAGMVYGSSRNSLHTRFAGLTDPATVPLGAT